MHFPKFELHVHNGGVTLELQFHLLHTEAETPEMPGAGVNALLQSRVCFLKFAATVVFDDVEPCFVWFQSFFAHELAGVDQGWLRSGVIELECGEVRFVDEEANFCWDGEDVGLGLGGSFGAGVVDGGSGSLRLHVVMFGCEVAAIQMKVMLTSEPRVV